MEVFANIANWLVGMLSDFNEAFFMHGRYLMYLKGLGMTLFLAFFACILGIAIGFVVTIIRIAPKDKWYMKVLDKIAWLYTTVIRGTPILIQLFLSYFAIMISIKHIGDGTLVAILTFGINSGAYVAEILRGGLLGVDGGQMEAGRSLGLNWFQTMRLVIIPQGLKSSIPALFNEFISLVKETSIASTISIVDLTKVGDKIISSTFNAYPPYFIIAGIYLIVVVGLQQIQVCLEKKLSKGDKR